MWNHTSSSMALFANANRDPKRRPTPFDPTDFSPYKDIENETNESGSFQLIHCSVFKSWSVRDVRHSDGTNTVTFGIKNLTHAVQSRPIIASEDPFSDDFDASRIYAPIELRRLFVKLAWTRWCLAGKSHKNKSNGLKLRAQLLRKSAR